METKKTQKHEFETVDVYFDQFHFEDAPGYDDSVRDSDDESIDRLLRRYSYQFTPDVCKRIGSPQALADFYNGDGLDVNGLYEVFGPGRFEEDSSEANGEFTAFESDAAFG